MISALIKNSNYNNLHYLNETGLYEIGDILIGLVAIQDTLISGDTSGQVENLPDFPWTDSKKYKHTIALYHGIIVSNDRSIYKDPIKIDWIQKYDFGLLGDIHRQHIYNSSWNKEGYYEIKEKGKIMWGYPGSLIQQTFGETINKHGYLLWDLDNYKVYSNDIVNRHAFCNLFYKDELWYTKIIDNGFKDKSIKFNKFLTKYPHIKNISIQVRNIEADSDEITEILKSNNVKCIRMSNKIINNDVINENYKTNDINNIQEYNSLETWYEFVNKNINDDNREILNKFNWKNIIKNPDSLLIDTQNIPTSLINKVNDKNDSITKHICKYLTARDEVLITNLLELKYMNWDWILCYKNDCYFNFENMDKNVMLLNADNGYGKSSFLEIICLGLFGTSIPSRHNKQFSSSIICNKKPKGVSSKIKIVFKLNDNEYILTRNFNKKSKDINKLDQKVELFRINKTGNNDNLVSLHSGNKSVSDWIDDNIGDSKTFFQSCMHTQNSDYDLFSMSFKEQKDLMDNSLSLQSINILIDIFKKTITNYTTIISHISTLDNEIKENHVIVDKEQVGILHNECTNLSNDINEIDNEIHSKKFPSEVKENDIELEKSIIEEKIKVLENLTKNKKFENISEILNYSGQLSSVIKQYKSNFNYYNIEYDYNGSNCSRSFCWDDVFGNIQKICERVLSTNMPKIKDIQKEEKLVKQYFNNHNLGDDNLQEEDININEKNDLEKLKNERDDRLRALTSSIQDILLKISSIVINYQKEELSKNLEKFEKMNKAYKKKEKLLKDNKICLRFFEENLNKIEENDKDILYTQQQIKKINETDYPFNPDCDCCLKQPWKIQLNELEKNLEEQQNNNSKIEKKIKDKEEDIKLNLEGIKKNIVKLDKWFNNYEDFKKNEKLYSKQLKLIIQKEKLQTEYTEKDTEFKNLNEELKTINIKLDKINTRLEYQSWIDRKEQNLKDKTEYNLYIKEKLAEWNIILECNDYLDNIIKENEENNKNLKLLKYWNMVLDLKPEWNKVKKQKKELKNKRNYLQNIRTKYLTLKKSYDDYVDECEIMKNYETILGVLKNKLDGVEILSKMFNNFRIWLYKEKLFPLVLNKINIIIGNMSKDNELLQLDIVWCEDTFNWFIVHNDNKIVINKASGYQKFIIDLSMRITLSSIGISSLKSNQLFIDEGFSTCDQDHLNKIPLFLNSLLNIYNSILVVSHIQEIKNCTSSCYDIKREWNLSLIEYGNNKNKEITEMIKEIKQHS